MTLLEQVTAIFGDTAKIQAFGVDHVEVRLHTGDTHTFIKAGGEYQHCIYLLNWYVPVWRSPMLPTAREAFEHNRARLLALTVRGCGP